MKIKILLLLSCIALLFSACSNHIYAPALLRQDIVYQPKPASFDSSKFATYISGDVNLYSNQTLDDQLTSGQINISQGITLKHVNIAYGVFGVAGDYENSTYDTNDDPKQFKDKFFGAVGGRASINYYVNSGRTDFRIIGIEAAYSHEYGSYANFRKQHYGDLDLYTDPRTELVTVGLTSEVLFHNGSNSNIQHGIRGFLGYTFGRDDLDVNPNDSTDLTFRESFFRYIIPKASYFVKIKHLIGTIEVGNGVFVRVGASF